MSVNTIGFDLSTQSDVTQLAQKVATALDTNSDGQVSTSEFASFLTQLLSQMGSQGGTTTSSSSSTMPSAATGDQQSLDVSSWVAPSSWTDNNAPYGVTLAGFSPEDHTDLTVNDLQDLKTPKYAVYDYLLSNQVMPTGDWATDAAKTLNSQFNTSIYQAASDGSKLTWGDQYVHTSANGDGLTAGAYDPGAVGEFLWGTA